MMCIYQAPIIYDTHEPGMKTVKLTATYTITLSMH